MADASSSLTIKSADFPPGGEIPRIHTCEGKNLSPALQWDGSPPHTASFALILDDPDAPAGNWTHWVLWNLPASEHRLRGGVPKRDQLENGAMQGLNSDHDVGYDGPCPPAGRAHRYFFRLYALARKVDLPSKASRADLLEAMKGHIVGEAEYMGTYTKGGGR